MKVSTRRASAFFITLLFFIPLLTQAKQITSAPIKAIDHGVPTWIYVPSIGLSSPIKGVGIDKKGNMDVPSGKTSDVGWYKHGTLPGNTGTAVLDAHVTAAFKDLEDIKIGESIYIYTSTGKILRFVTKKAKTYEAKTTDPRVLFAPSKSPDLNLITCAGTLLGDGEATHRLIVTAKLAA